jgi:hypothetical protein
VRHRSGGPKAVVFRALGYRRDEWERLQSDLRAQHLDGDAELSSEDEHGVYHVIRGTLTGPNGRSGRFMSVWFVRFGEDFPRFITAYPREK